MDTTVDEQPAAAAAKTTAEAPRGRRGHPVLPGGLGRSTFAVGGAAPLAVRGAGPLLWDADGRELIDLNANFTTLVHGHAHPRIVAAAQRATAAGASYGLPNRSEMLHAEALLDRMPHYDQVRFTNSGTEAISTALRVARAATGRDMVAFARRCYHGTSDHALVPGGEAARRGVSRGVIEETLVLAVNDVVGLERAVERHGDRLAALVIDRLPNRAGLIAMTPAYAIRARELCDRHGIVLIGDEVITFRLAVGGVASEDGVVPDLVTLGKLIGGGHPIGAVVGGIDLMCEFDLSRHGGLEHGGTFSGNPVSMEAGRVALELLDAEAVGALNDRCDRARERLAADIASAGWEVRGRGSLMRLFPTGGRDETAWQRALWWEAYERGVLLMQTALIAVPTVLDEAGLTKAVDAVSAAALAVSERFADAPDAA